MDGRAGAAPESGRVPALDGLRGIAILLVIVSHYLGAYWRTASAGWTGVNLFFVLSGFLITGILLDAKDKPHYFRNFYARRTLRIFPLYYLVLVLVFVVAPWIPSLDTESYRALAGRQVWFWTYTANFYVGAYGEIGADPFACNWIGLLHLWSLSVEEQFYLVWPFIVLFTSRRQLIGICGVFFVGAWLMRLHYITGPMNPQPYFFTQCRVDDLAIGALIAAVARDKGGVEKLRACAPWLSIAAIWVLLGVGVELRHFFQLAADVERWAYSAFSVLYGCLLVFAIAAPQTNLYRRALENRVLRSYGKYSYAIYIFHWGLSELLFARIAPLDALSTRLGSQDVALAIRVIIVAVVSWGIGWLSWNLYEKHFLKLKRGFYAKSEDESPSRSSSRIRA